MTVARRSWTLIMFTAFAALTAACAGGSQQPASLQAGDTCTSCRMVISDARFAAQVVAPGEEPQFFDDIGCLAGQLRRVHPAEGAVAYVTDHRTGAWVSAAAAVYTRVDALTTPMGSHLVAHHDAASRDQDPSAQAGVNVTASEIFGSALPGGSNDAR